MARVALFFFTMYDINADKIVRSRRPATLDAIRKFGGSPIMETEQQLDSSKVDDDGLLKIGLPGIWSAGGRTDAIEAQCGAIKVERFK